MFKQILITVITILVLFTTNLFSQDTVLTIEWAGLTRTNNIVLVKAVHDGDSYKIQWGNGDIEWVRLWGCDAPEVVSNHITKAQPYGVQTGNFVRSLLKGQYITIDTSVAQDDPFLRRVIKVKLDSALYSRIDSVPGEYVNDLSTYLVLNGFAWWSDKSLQDDMEIAKDTKIGLWSLSGRKLRPETWRRRNWN